MQRAAELVIFSYQCFDFLFCVSNTYGNIFLYLSMVDETIGVLCECVSIWGFANFSMAPPHPHFPFTGATLLQSSFSVARGVEQGYIRAVWGMLCSKSLRLIFT